jgi:hypothetical protein
MSLTKQYAVWCDGINGDFKRHDNSCRRYGTYWGTSQKARRHAISKGWRRIGKGGLARDLSPACAAAEDELGVYVA